MGKRRRNRPKPWLIGVFSLVGALIAATGAYQLTQKDGDVRPAAQRQAVAVGITGAAATSPAVPSPGSTPSAPVSASTPPSPASAATAGPTAPAAAGSRQITLVNALGQTIWAATNQNSRYPLPVTGWRLAPGQSVTFSVPAAWGGRVWGRTGCAFDSGGGGHCQTGDCGGVFQCKNSGATPATLAELTLSSFDGLDFYDVSMVDGANLPMYINTTHRTDADPVSPTGCYRGACTTAVACPAAMQVKAGGQTVACETACAAFGTDDYCCRGAWSGRTNCDPAKWPVDYAKLVFKDAEPYAYSYAYDDAATMACKGGCDYRITFGVTPG